MSVSFSVNISLPLPSSPSPSHNSTRNFFQTEGKAHCLRSIQEEKFKIKEFNLKVMKYVMKCRFIVVAIPDTYKAVSIFFFWYGRRNQYPHSMVLNTLQQAAHGEKSPDWRSSSRMGSQQSLWIRGRTIISIFEIQVRHRKRKCRAQKHTMKQW